MYEIESVLPGELRLTMVRGDTFERKMFQSAEYVNPDVTEDTVPADVREHQYIFEIRETPLDTDDWPPLIGTSQEDDEIIFGQSDDALAYDTVQGNPPGTTFDEVHVMLPAHKTRIDPGTYWWGLRVVQASGVVELLLQDKITVIPDTPKYTEEP